MVEESWVVCESRRDGEVGLWKNVNLAQPRFDRRMPPEVPVDAAEEEEQDEITLKYQRLLPNHLLAVSPALSALHYNRLHRSKIDFDGTDESVRCPRCGHFVASTRVSIPRVGLGSSNDTEAAGARPAAGVVITRTCGACNRRTVVSANDGRSADGRQRMRSVRARLKGQQASSPPTTSTSGARRGQLDPEREAKVSVRVRSAQNLTNIHPELIRNQRKSM